MAARHSSRRVDPRSDGDPHDNVGAGAPARRRVRRSTFPSRLLSVLAVLASDDSVPNHAAWTTRSPRTAAGVQHVFLAASDIDLQRTATARAASRLG